MEPLPLAFARSRSAFYWPLATVVGLWAVSAVVLAASSSIALDILVGCPLILLSLFQVRRAVQWYRDRDPIVEVHDYCVIDMRFFKEWVYWQDVREIVLIGSGIIALKVENEDHYARDWKCICQRLHGLLSDEPLPKLLIVSGMLACTSGELLAAIRMASEPYGIPIRQFAEEAAPTPSLLEHERLRHFWTVALSTPQRMLSWR